MITFFLLINSAFFKSGGLPSKTQTKNGLKITRFNAILQHHDSPIEQTD
jgi:hypothetical protein